MNAIDHGNNRYERVILVLQGGGALGAYQAGVYEGLVEGGCVPNWITGVSIGAIHAALIAGNPPDRRVQRLREFWERVSCMPTMAAPPRSDPLYRVFGRASAAWSASFGVPGFFGPRLPPAVLMPRGDSAALSLYDARPLEKTLEELVDFKLLNKGGVRLSIGAVNVTTGNSTYFDSATTQIGAKHVMASAALPPAFAPVEIDGEFYWDGGVVSNTPLWYVLDDSAGTHALILQVDLFSARGNLPQNLEEVMERHKDIQYSSKTRFNTTRVMELQQQRRALHRLLQKLPATLQADEDVTLLQTLSSDRQIDIVHLIHRRYDFTTHAKDYEFSRASVDWRWAAGLADARQTLGHRDWPVPTELGDGVRVYDFTREPRALPSAVVRTRADSFEASNDVTPLASEARSCKSRRVMGANGHHPSLPN